VEVVKSAPGLTLQRNLALTKVLHPVVFFPDDDSIWFPNVAALKMAVYEADTKNRISAVCGAESREPPPGFGEGEKIQYSMRKYDRIRQRTAHLRTKFERWLVPDPAGVLGREFISEGKPQEWWPALNVTAVGWMTGFRMSFRTQVAQAHQFDPAFTGYSLFEDIDASFSAWRLGAVVASLNARIFHYKSPERRDAGLKLGVAQILNKAYVIAKHALPSSRAKKAASRFFCYKRFQYKMAARDQFGKDRYDGAKRALNFVPDLLQRSPPQLTMLFETAWKECRK